MKRKHEDNETHYYEVVENVPMNENEVIIETTPSPKYGEAEHFDNGTDDQYVNNVEQYTKEVQPNVLIPLVQTVSQRIAADLIVPEVDIVELGKEIVMGISENQIETNKPIQRAVKLAQEADNPVGFIDISSLVSNIMFRDAIDVRFPIVGTSLMWNSLKQNLQDVNSLKSSMASSSSGDILDCDFDLDPKNVKYRQKFTIDSRNDFVGIDLFYLFENVEFRENSKLLNKTKLFLKTYFTLACNPRCLIWRYTLRKSGATHKKTISDLPMNIVNMLIDFLLTLTGIGCHNIDPTNVCRATPFYRNLGSTEDERNEGFSKLTHCRDKLVQFFRNSIVDCLNEVREMPFCLESGRLIAPLRGRASLKPIVDWKSYELYLRREIDEPCQETLTERVRFEEKMFKAANFPV